MEQNRNLVFSDLKNKMVNKNMMFVTILIMFALMGSLFMMMELWFPIPLIPLVNMGMEVTGAILIFIGIMLYLMRSLGTGACHLIELPNALDTICIHNGKSNAKILKGKKQEPNRIRAKGKGYRGSSKFMNIKDTGDAINVAGHDVVVTSQDVGHNIPLFIADAIDIWKRNLKVNGHDELVAIQKQLEHIRSHDELKSIPVFAKMLEDPEKAEVLLGMDLDDIRELSAVLYDGRTINIRSYLDWFEGATPYDNEAIIDSDVSHRLSQMANFLKGSTGDMMKYVIIMFIIVIIGIIAYQGFA